MKKIFLLFLFLLSLNANSFSELNIAKNLILYARANNLDERALYTIAKIESGFKPLIISCTNTNENFCYKGQEGIKMKVNKYGKKYLI